MKLFCPNCGRAIAPESVDLAAQAASCGSCGRLFNFGERLGSSREAVGAGQCRALIPRPAKMLVERSLRGCTISWRWFSPMHIGLAFFCAAWDSFLIFWYSVALTQNAPWIMIVFPIGHLAVGVGLTYLVLAGFINRTRIELSSSTMRISHYPLPWWGNREIPSSQLRQLYCEISDAGREQMRYVLSAVMRDGRKLKLLKTSSSDEARFLEQTIEGFYHIADRAVTGELRAE